MCGRFTLRTPMSKVVEQFQLPLVDVQLPLRYNIAPSQPVAAVRMAAAGESRELAMLKWGLVPPFAKDKSIGNRMINARSETAATRSAFRDAFQHRRCLVPADGFFEWETISKKKQPHYITLRDGGLFAIAGLWERWERGGQVIESCTLLTTDANRLLEPLHDRMPVIVPPDAYERWLDARIKEAEPFQEIMKPFAAEAMTIMPVNAVVNSPANDDPSCIQRVEQRLLFE